ncbi:hypothetical protein [Massilia genomosp. 1]|uniref:Uncharacterized protein n=1 Tax=Massilia genomosp. 1 TaxID=2609280 RepID=A0ABX0MVA8_9BURK|nr:hypothetical protein [Massilia genomosp. 1]NHZ63214.1 hypothetical protein [Massilia genomosp. 1]
MQPERMRTFIDACDERAKKFTSAAAGQSFFRALEAEAADIAERPVTVMLLGSPGEFPAFSPKAFPMHDETASLTLFRKRQGEGLAQFHALAQAPRTVFGGADPLPELRLAVANEDITGAPWIRLLLAHNLNPATAGAHVAHYLQRFVHIVVVGPGAGSSTALDSLATLLGNAHAAVVLLDKSNTTRLAAASALKRVIASSLPTHELRPETLPALLQDMRLPLAAMHYAALAKRARKQLQLEGERVAAVHAITLLAHKLPEVSAGRVFSDSAWKDVCAAIRSNFDTAIRTLEDHLKQPLLATADSLVGVLGPESVEWTDPDGAGDRVLSSPPIWYGSLLAHEFLLTIKEARCLDIQVQIATISANVFKKGCARIRQLQEETRQSVADKMVPLLPDESMAALELTPPPPLPAALGGGFRVNPGTPEKFVSGGLMGIFNKSKGVIQNLMAIVLFFSIAAAAGVKVFSTPGAREIPTSAGAGTSGMKDVRAWITLIAAGAVVVLIPLIARQMPRMESKQIEELGLKLRSNLVASTEKALKDGEKLRHHAYADVIARLKKEFAEFMSKADDHVNQYTIATSAAANKLHNDIDVLTWIIKEKQAGLQLVVQQASNLIAHYEPQAEPALTLAAANFSGQAAPPAPAGNVAPPPPAPQPPASPTSAPPSAPALPGAGMIVPPPASPHRRVAFPRTPLVAADNPPHAVQP